MSILRYRGLLVIVAWQTVPGPIAVDSTGRVQGVFGFGGGQYEVVSTTCEGDVIDTSASGFVGGGAAIDAWATRSLRLTGYAGSISSDSVEWDGGYFGGLAALELQRFGIGFGAVRVPSHETWPAAYLRIGNRDVVHGYADIAPADPPLGTTGMLRLGLGYRRGHLRQPGLLGGLAVCHAWCDGESNASAFAELRYPVGSWLDLEARALAGPGKGTPNLGFAISGRVHSGN